MEAQLVFFTLGKENYALEIEKVASIIKPLPLTKIPQAPYAVDGIINLRGKVIPVMNSRQKFDFPPTTETKDTRVIIVNIGQQQIGLLVDSVSEVARVADSNFEAPPSIIAASNNIIQSIVNFNNRIISVLDLEKINFTTDQIQRVLVSTE